MDDERGSRRPARAGLAGLLAAAVALGTAELVAAFVDRGSSPLVAVGAVVIDWAPTWLEQFAIATFGAANKLVLSLGVIVVLAGVAAALGYRAWGRPVPAILGVLLLGAAGAVAALTDPGSTWLWSLPALVGAVTGAAVLLVLIRLARGTATRHRPREVAGATSPPAVTTGPDRRSFVLGSVGAAALAGVSGGAGRFLSERRFAVASSRSAVRLPRPDSPAPSLPTGTRLDVPGMPRFFTPNGSFYRVDTVLALPRVPAEEWSLRVHGMVDRELTLTYDDLLRRPLIERDITLACVSNPVGGPYVGNARWLGVRLADLLREAGVRADADEVLSRSADGWTCGTPAATIMDGRDAMLAVAMNGEPLPLAHGFPVRMVVPGLYGFVSATKWVVDIELTRFARAKPYWATRGWALRAPVKTMARIDTPTSATDVRAGRVPVAGVAWAQHRGIDRVEVRVDGGPWHEARKAKVPSADTWRQWVHYWDAEPGEHELQVRATDGRGRTQTSRENSPLPDGATGWHTASVTVT